MNESSPKRAYTTTSSRLRHWQSITTHRAETQPNSINRIKILVVALDLPPPRWTWIGPLMPLHIVIWFCLCLLALNFSDPRWAPLSEHISTQTSTGYGRFVLINRVWHVHYVSEPTPQLVYSTCPFQAAVVVLASLEFYYAIYSCLLGPHCSLFSS